MRQPIPTPRDLGCATIHQLREYVLRCDPDGMFEPAQAPDDSEAPHAHVLQWAARIAQAGQQGPDGPCWPAADVRVLDDMAGGWGTLTIEEATLRPNGAVSDLLQPIGSERADTCYVCGTVGRDGERWGNGDTCDRCALSMRS